MQITDPILMFSFIMFVLLLAPMLLTRLKLPGIAGLIIAGIIVGPHALGIIRAEGTFELLSAVGLIYIMFLAGLEINLHEFSRKKKFSIVFGALTFSIPMIAGTLGGKYLFSFSWPTAVLLASMFASHTLIPFPITTRLGINRSRPVVTAVGGTIITDTAALLVLAVIAEWATTNITAFFWVRQGLLLILLVWFALWLLPRIAYFFFRILSPDGATEFVFILAMVFLTSHLAHLAGVEPIIGAFFAGLAFSRIVPEQSPLMSRLEFVGNALFIPFFLVSVGMLINLRTLAANRTAWAVALFMTGAVIVCKHTAAMLFARLMKFSRDEGKLIFGLSVNQAAATLAAVIVGYRIGLFREEVLNGTILMILVSCLVGSWITDKYGRRIALGEMKLPVSPTETREKIMIAVSRNESVEPLTDMAMILRDKTSSEPLFPLFVAQDGWEVDKCLDTGEKILSRAVARIVSASIPVSPVTRIDVNIPHGILHALKENHVTTLVMGTSRYASNMKNLFFSVYEKVAGQSRQLLVLCRAVHPLNIDKRIFLAIPPLLEVQPGFNRAFHSARNLAVRNKMAVRIIAETETGRNIKYLLKNIPSAISLSFDTLKDWKELPGHLKNAGVLESDFLVFMAARKGRLAWQPSVERFFSAACMDFAENNVILMIPPDYELPSAGQETKPPSGEEGRSAAAGREFSPLNVVRMDGMPSEKALRTLLESWFPGRKDAIGEIMHNLLPLDPVELTPEAVLFHTHSAGLKEPVILLGVNRSGFTLPSLKYKPQVFFLLLSPKDATTVHLQALAKVARMAQAPGFISRLCGQNAA